MANNAAVQMLRDLQEASGRREHGAFLLEGDRIVAEAVAAKWPLIAVLYDAERARDDPDLASLLSRIPEAVPASSRDIKRAADTVTPQGIVAAARMPRSVKAIDLDEPLVLVLDGVSDPGNAGTLLRSAVASGVRTVLTTSGSVDLFAPKVVRGGMGAHFRLNIGSAVGWDAIREKLGPGRAIVLAERAATTPHYRFDWRRPTALVIGSEAHGPGPEARALATATVSIPLEHGVESLNAAVAGSVILFEAKRQRDLGTQTTRTESTG